MGANASMNEAVSVFGLSTSRCFEVSIRSVLVLGTH